MSSTLPSLPFSPEEMGTGGEPELSETQRLLGMTEPGKRPEKTKVTIYSPSEGKVESYTLGPDGTRIESDEGDSARTSRRPGPSPRRSRIEAPRGRGGTGRRAGFRSRWA